MQTAVNGLALRIGAILFLGWLCICLLFSIPGFAQTPEPAVPSATEAGQTALTETAEPTPDESTVGVSAEPPAPTMAEPAPAPVPVDKAPPPETNPFDATPEDFFAYIPTFLWNNILMNGLIAWAITIGLVVWLVTLIQENNRLKEILSIERNLKESSQRQLEFQALYDPLTQLPNRRLFHDRLLETLKMANRSRTRFGIMVTDLDHFKEINDTMGHDAGDELLEQVSKRLRTALRESDTLARMGGDEFALICPSVNDFKTASVVCMRIISALQQPIIVKNKELQVGISIGVALFPDHGADNDILLRRADIAMYRAKIKRNAYALYDPDLDRKA